MYSIIQRQPLLNRFCPRFRGGINDESRKNQLVPFRPTTIRIRYPNETFKSIEMMMETSVKATATRINGCTGTDPWIEGRSRIEDPEDPPPLTHPLPRLSIPPAHFQPPRTLSFFSSPLNPLFLFVQRFLFSLERERERLRDATMPANKCKPIRSCRRRFAYDRLPSSRDFSHFRDQHLLIYPWTTRVNLG